MLRKLEYYGIRGKALDWFRSYLSNRTQYVEYKNVKSNFSKIEYGMPQGSVLGPLLFIIYMNDLPNCLIKSKGILFADDTNIYMRGKCKKQLFAAMKQELEKLKEWFQANKLSLNLQKTNYVLFQPKGASTVDNNLQLTIGAETIARKSSVKFLGIYLDEHLQWTEQFKQLNSKLSKANYIIRSVKNILDSTCLKMLYYSLFYSHLNYGIIVWGTSMPQGSLNKLFKSQKKVIRSISDAGYNAHTDPLFKDHRILKVNDVIDTEILKCMYCVSKSLSPPPILDLFVPNAIHHHHFTRRRHDPKIIARKYAPLDRSYLCRGPAMWSALHPDIKNSKTIQSFKNKIKRKNIDKY